MNIQKLDNDRWRVESESRPGLFYEVIAGSSPARNFGVKYSCDCPAWINNTNGTRICKHTQAVLKEELMQKTTENFRSNTVTNPTMATSSAFRSRGRPRGYEVEQCTNSNCGKSSITLKQKGYCKYCFRKRDGSIAGWSERSRSSYVTNAETSPIISDNTVKVQKEEMRELAKELGL